MPDRGTRILVLGARGMLGAAMCKALEGIGELTAWDIDELDITERRAVIDALQGLAPDEVVNCAGITDVDGCESRVESAMAVNSLAPGHIAEACARSGARLTHISTEYVFDGRSGRDYTEEDRPNPLSVYGRSKLAGEQAVKAAGCRFAVIRTQWLYGAGGKNFVDTIKSLIERKQDLRVVNDQIGRPTWARDLAAALGTFLRTDGEGVYHLAASGACSWYDVAVAVADMIGIPGQIDPVSTSEFPRPAARPLRAVLDCSRIRREHGIALRHWRDALAEYLRNN